MESANVKIDEYTKIHEDEQKKEPKNYKTFMYYYEGMSSNTDDTENQATIQQELVTFESHTMDVELHSGSELQSEAMVHSDAEIILQERNVELLDKEVHSEPEIELHEWPIVEERRTEPRLSKYVKRHHPSKQIIGEKEDGPMVRNRLRNETCLLIIHKPKIVKDALENED